MKTVVDRLVQYANRYKLTNVETGQVLGTFDFDAVTGTIHQEGTEINSELFESISNDFENINNGTQPVGALNTKYVSLDNLNVINDFKGPEYWGKIYNASEIDQPDDPNVVSNSFILEILRGDHDSTVQRLTDILGYYGNTTRPYPPTMYIREYRNDDAFTGWTEWKEIAISNGTYDNMVVGKSKKDANGNVIHETYSTNNDLKNHSENNNNPHNVTAKQVGAYVKPFSGIPKTDLAEEVKSSLEKANSALQKESVTSVDGKTGDVDLSDKYASQTGTYENMTVGKSTNSTNSTNISVGRNDSINPEGRGEGEIGLGSTAIGAWSVASATNSTVFGRQSVASATGACAIGPYSEASARYACTLGAETVAKATASTAIGYEANVAETDNNTMQLGSSGSYALSTLRCKVNLSVTSDKRDKTDINNITNALPFIDKLNPVTFVSNDRVNYISEEDKKSEKFRKYGMCDYDRVAHAAGTKKGERRRCGLLAQEVVEAMQTVYGTDNYANIVNDNFHDLQEKPSDVENKYTLAYANLVPFLIGAIKELNAKIKILEDKLQ